MAAELIKGTPLAREMTERLTDDLKKLTIPPRVAAIHNTQDAGVGYYLRSQKKLCEKNGVVYDVHPIDAKTTPAKVLALIDRLNADPSITGISVHLPPPKGFDPEVLVTRVDPRKDIEAIHPQNLGQLVRGNLGLAPCAAAAAVELARRVRPMRGLEATVVGRSPIVGLPVALLLLRMGKDAPTVTVCHTATANLAAHARRADVLFTAAGRVRTVYGGMIKPGATVIDISVNPVADDRIAGDVVFDEALEVAGAITPVPGGVGPVTLAILLRNIVTCARKVSP